MAKRRSYNRDRRAVVIEISCLERPASHTTHGNEARHQIGFFSK